MNNTIVLLTQKEKVYPANIFLCPEHQLCTSQLYQSPGPKAGDAMHYESLYTHIKNLNVFLKERQSYLVMILCHHHLSVLII